MSNEQHPEFLSWSRRARVALDLYRDDLVRQVATKLIRPRTTWSPEELRERMEAALDDPVSIDRTLKPLGATARQLLRLIAITDQPSWSLQSLNNLLPALGHDDGIGPIIELLESGIAYPELDGVAPVESFESWLAPAAAVPRNLFIIPLAMQRCRTEPLDLDVPTGEPMTPPAVMRADGLEFLLRLAVLWQSVRDTPIRLTQSGDFFKRDLDRLHDHPLLSVAPADAPVAFADPALFVVEMARHVGVLEVSADSLSVGKLPATWIKGLGAAVTEFWSAIFRIQSWDPLNGYEPPPSRVMWTVPASALLAFALSNAESKNWLSIAELADWLGKRLPEWKKTVETLQPWAETWLLGVLQQLQLVEAAKADDRWLVRLTELGRAVLAKEAMPAPSPPMAQTLLVQPNLEVVLYRQGMSPALAIQLTQFAEWRLLGLACMLALTAESVYRGLESGTSLVELQRLLERHSTRGLSDSVLDTLRSWASKRERVQVYTNAVLLEFRTALELDQAMKQGLADIKITDRIGLVSSDSKLEYSRFRLVGTRDYLSPEERCVEVDDDGLTMTVHDGRADLLLGAELRRIAEPIEPMAEDRSRFRATLESLRSARRDGVDLRWLNDWFSRRVGQPLPPTAKLLFMGGDSGSATIENWIILRLESEEMADGVENWPAAQELFVERLGATTFAVNADDAPALRELLKAADIIVS